VDDDTEVSYYDGEYEDALPAFTIYEVLNDTHTLLTYGSVSNVTRNSNGKFVMGLVFDANRAVIDATTAHAHYGDEGAMSHSHSVPLNTGNRVTVSQSAPLTGTRGHIIMDIYFLKLLRDIFGPDDYDTR
jgi:hypothetical protein